MSFLKSLFSPKMQRETVFEHLIETLANKDDHCEWLPRITYEAVTSYMKEASGRVLREGKAYPEESVLYEITVNKRAYRVMTSRDMQRTGILFTSKFREDWNI